eukprot:TRINITY_DN10053_c0_g1_i1.p1 TRINITY_DN10053_c0_g1~~TRINITY_DN10053_c0_g1_i1.p1  ORF type:complete len:618 (+),score=185.30 TRINITY_DN10053_c0_g1_i1:253-2106(+)
MSRTPSRRSAAPAAPDAPTPDVEASGRPATPAAAALRSSTAEASEASAAAGQASSETATAAAAGSDERRASVSFALQPSYSSDSDSSGSLPIHQLSAAERKKLFRHQFKVSMKHLRLRSSPHQQRLQLSDYERLLRTPDGQQFEPGGHEASSPFDEAKDGDYLELLRAGGWVARDVPLDFDQHWQRRFGARVATSSSMLKAMLVHPPDDQPAAATAPAATSPARAVSLPPAADQSPDGHRRQDARPHDASAAQDRDLSGAASRLIDAESSLVLREATKQLQEATRDLREATKLLRQQDAGRQQHARGMMLLSPDSLLAGHPMAVDPSLLQSDEQQLRMRVKRAPATPATAHGTGSHHSSLPVLLTPESLAKHSFQPIRQYSKPSSSSAKNKPGTASASSRQQQQQFSAPADHTNNNDVVASGAAAAAVDASALCISGRPLDAAYPSPTSDSVQLSTTMSAAAVGAGPRRPASKASKALPLPAAGGWFGASDSDAAPRKRPPTISGSRSALLPAVQRSPSESSLSARPSDKSSSGISAWPTDKATTDGSLLSASAQHVRHADGGDDLHLKLPGFRQHLDDPAAQRPVSKQVRVAPADVHPGSLAGASSARPGSAPAQV